MSTGGFWTFSVAFYGRPGVSAACLQLQDDHGMDVNMVLWALWCAARGCRLEPGDFARADTAVAAWRETILRGIRRTRRALKPPPAAPFEAAAAEALRRQLLAAELAAERLQQDAMAVLAPPPGTAGPHAAAEANLAYLARHAGVAPDAAPWRTLLGAFT